MSPNLLEKILINSRWQIKIILPVGFNGEILVKIRRKFKMIFHVQISKKK